MWAYLQARALGLGRPSIVYENGIGGNKAPLQNYESKWGVFNSSKIKILFGVEVI
jgi:hypothetical protein